MRYSKTGRGAALLTTILVIGSAGMVGFLALAQTSISRVVSAQQYVDAADVRLKTYGCLDEMLIQIKGDPNFTVPPSLDISTGTCSFSSSVPAAGQLAIEIRYSEGNLYFGFHVVVETATATILELYPNLN